MAPFAKFRLPFFVVSLIYAPPGNNSSNGFTDSASDGVMATISATFAVNNTESFMETDGQDFTISQGESLSVTETVGASASFQETLTGASGIQLKSVEDPIDHYQDHFWLWLNPRVTVAQTGTTTGAYSVGTQIDSNGNPEPVDLLDVSVAELLNPNEIPLDKLQPRIIDGVTVPGISSICEHQVACSVTNACGCVPADFTEILKQDPLVYPVDPATVLASGSNRFIKVDTNLLEGPDTQGAPPTSTSFTVTDQQILGQSLSDQISVAEGFSFGFGEKTPDFSLTQTSSNTFTLTEQATLQVTNGTSHAASVTFGTSAVDCLSNIDIWEDGVFHTFAFIPSAAPPSCLTPKADFNLVVFPQGPNSQTVSPGSSATFGVSSVAMLGFTGSETLSVSTTNGSGLPTGITATFSPSSLDFSSTNIGNSVLTISIASTAVNGTYPLTVTGTSGTISHSINLTLIVELTRTWVSSAGSDTNPCSRTAPCSTFARALTQTFPGGEIDVLDPGSYGPVTIAQSLTIDGGENQAGYVLASSGNGIVIQAGANDVVTLRNLQVDGNGSGANGIRFLSGKNLSIEDSHIFGFTQNGIDIEVNAASTVQITDTVVKNSGNDGIFVTSTSGLARVGIFNSQIIASSNNGVEGSSNGWVTVHYSLISGSGGSGAIADGTNGCGNVGIDNSDIVSGNNAVTATNSCFLNIGHSHLGYNNTGTAYNQTGGNIVVWTRGTANASNGTNVVHDNAAVGSAIYVTEQ